MNSISKDKFAALLARAKSLSQAKKEEEEIAAISSLETTLHEKQPYEVDLSRMGITPASLQTEEGQENAVEILRDISNSSNDVVDTSLSIPTSVTSLGSEGRKTGVAADVTLNQKQNEFVTRLCEGEDVVLLGAAGTGKTTATGKAIRALEELNYIEKTGTSTKWIKSHVPGILIVSYTRKAVNNIKRAVPEHLREHTLTMHKVLEFEPIFYDIFDSKTGESRTTMKFEPKRTRENPIPEGIKLVVYEESSMIGVDLYELFIAALPHQPQEVFIGDIQQLPPIFGPAILGFKMSLLPVVQLTEVYRQALQSPIIRLAHAILSGDSNKFSPQEIVVEQEHAHLGKVMERKVIPSLEAYNEDSPHGMVKIQIWQKTLRETTALHTVVLQFKAWAEQGYYDPNDDIIICPFNKALGTLEINKGIANYLARKEGRVVHEVISGFNKHYLAVGDRVLFDKEDAFITDIKRNANYLGKSFLPASTKLDRWGAFQEDISEEKEKEEKEEYERQQKEDKQAADDALDDFLSSVSEEDEDRVNAASHIITIKFAYSDEVNVLSSSGDINNLLGGYALTAHKMQGSENRAVFVVLHKSHAVMCNNELLYTIVTRAREKLHIICEIDSFYKGVKRHAVRGRLLEDKIDYFKGKIEFKQMAEEMARLEERKKEKLALVKERRKQKSEESEESEEENEEDDNDTVDVVDYTLLDSDFRYPDRDSIFPDQTVSNSATSEKVVPPMVTPTVTSTRVSALLAALGKRRR